MKSIGALLGAIVILLLSITVVPRILGQLTSSNYPWIVDNASVVMSGYWKQIQAGYGGEVFVGSKDEHVSAEWEINHAAIGESIQVWITWPTGAANIATNARLQVFNGGAEMMNKLIDQTVTPGPTLYEGSYWQEVGTFVYDDVIKVRLSNHDQIDGFLVADAVAFVTIDNNEPDLEKVDFGTIEFDENTYNYAYHDEAYDDSYMDEAYIEESCDDPDYGLDYSIATTLMQTAHPEVEMYDRCVRLTEDLTMEEVESCEGQGCMVEEFECIGFTPNHQYLPCDECLRGICVQEGTMDTLTHDTYHMSDPSVIPLTITIPPEEEIHLIRGARGTSDSVLMRFDAASGDQDVLLDSIKLTASKGSLDDARDYSLRITNTVDYDANGNPVTETLIRDVNPTGGVLHFRDLKEDRALIPSWSTVTFEITATPREDGKTSNLQLQFALPLPSFITANYRDSGEPLVGISTDGGNCDSACEIDLYYSPSITWQLAEKGSLIVSSSYAYDVSPMQLLGGSLTEPLLEFNLEALYEEIAVDEIQISSKGNEAISIDLLKLYTQTMDGEETWIGDATVTDCNSSQTPVLDRWENKSVRTFCSDLNKLEDRQLLIGENESVRIIVRALMQSDAPDFGAPGISGEKITLMLPGSHSGEGRGSIIRAHGMQSLTALSSSNEDGAVNGEVLFDSYDGMQNLDLVGGTHTAVMSKVVSIEDNNPDSTQIFQQPVREGIANLGQFIFRTGTHANDGEGVNEWVLAGVIFTIESGESDSNSNVSFKADSFRIFNRASESATFSCSPVLEDGSPNTDEDGRPLARIEGRFHVICTDINSSGSPVDAAIAQNGGATFVLQGEIANDRVDPKMGSSYRVILDQIFDHSLKEFGVMGSHLHWIDQDGTTSQSYFWTEDAEGMGRVESTTYRLD